MLPRRLIASVTTAAAVLAMAACGQPIRENLVEPGITAMRDARGEACALDATNLRTAIEIYEIRNGEPPANEAALIPDYIREETTSWNIVDGELVAENPACGSVVDAAPTQVDIVTDEGSGTAGYEARTAEEYLADLSGAQIDALGGSDCAGELADIFAGVDTYIVETGLVPDSFQEIVDAGLLETPQRWQVDGGELTPVPGTGCVHPDDALAEP